ncbi:breast cancer metastasis-suppressor 1 [Culex quinquefasciatus]|uniref:Breast cancer metastasis-suppressor 1 n=3 Tax=Culex pipiens complex TaxID=518105 RepID=B0W6S0_CULQU|nr:breast cancer metastasis-suppressor 1-like protein [Culex quinquefasciatus]XP_039436507.1 breast cancer metastasis-suppressor 1-like protein [Culex pipiens pallens]XP_039436508.1 breast cancer metastasis-suppressor 1-like protein [Culex pipiens pallens]EDS36901.1 breast cancer metastasis-suppressor 1 [Culex quinquefasciatus]|eukprot:XP_001844404.1 breast cancer metastasis-suppressor 1 [Culex quinquefasciatus]
MAPVKNEGESDGDMSGAESDHSASSRARSAHDSSAEEADEPDSDDSSEMSEGECERRRSDCLDNLTNLEKQFTILKEQLYKEKMNQVDQQLQDIRGGRSQEYLAPLQRLSDQMNSRKEVAEILKNFRMDNIRHKFESELQAARQHFESEKQLAMDAIYEELMEKIRRLEEDRHNVDISWADWGTSTRTSKVRGPGRKKAVTVSGPYVVYMLREEDILEDWTAIRKALKRSTAAAT